MTKAQAELCAELALRPRSPLQESAAHAALLDCAQSFSPCVEDTACDTALLDLAGMESLLGPLPRNFTRHLQPRDHARTRSQRCHGLQCRSGRARRPRILRHHRNSGRQGSRATWTVTAGVLFGDRLEGERERGSRSPARNLRSLGHSQPARAGRPAGSRSQRTSRTRRPSPAALARGTASRTLVPVEAPLVFEEAVELEHPIVLLEPLAFLLNRLLDQLCARLGLTGAGHARTAPHAGTFEPYRHGR